MGESARIKSEMLTVVVACRVMQPELERARRGNSHVEIRYVDQGLHRTPRKMPERVQEEIDRVAPRADRIVLGYGLCSNGIVGVAAREQGLIVPRCHDCIAFFLGSPAAYKEAFEARPGTYYLTPGWVAEEKDPLSIVEKDYEPRYGREMAVWAMEEELKHYTHIALIDTGAGDIATVRRRALENARFFKKEYEEIQGSPEYFSRIIRNPDSSEHFLHLRPGEKVTQAMFFDESL
jgi:hypothetical protein